MGKVLAELPPEAVVVYETWHTRGWNGVGESSHIEARLVDLAEGVVWPIIHAFGGETVDDCLQGLSAWAGYDLAALRALPLVARYEESELGDRARKAMARHAAESRTENRELAEKYNKGR